MPAKPIPVHGNPTDLRWPFNNPGYWLAPDVQPRHRRTRRRDPALTRFPISMLVDWIRIW